MVGMVLSAGQTVMPGGWMGAEGSPTPVVLMAPTLPLTTVPLMRLGHCAPAPKLKLFWRRRSLKRPDRKSTRLNSSHLGISYAVFCLKKKKKKSSAIKTEHETHTSPRPQRRRPYL